MLSCRGQATQLSSFGKGFLFSYKDRNLWLDRVTFSYVLIYHVYIRSHVHIKYRDPPRNRKKERRNIGFSYRRLLLDSCCRAHAASFDRSRTYSFSCYPSVLLLSFAACRRPPSHLGHTNPYSGFHVKLIPHALPLGLSSFFLPRCTLFFSSSSFLLPSAPTQCHRQDVEAANAGCPFQPSRAQECVLALSGLHYGLFLCALFLGSRVPA